MCSPRNLTHSLTLSCCAQQALIGFVCLPKSSCCHVRGLTVCSVVQVLLSICSLLTDPNPDDPLVPEIAHM